jgi:hypothetical protein
MNIYERNGVGVQGVKIAKFSTGMNSYEDSLDSSFSWETNRK